VPILSSMERYDRLKVADLLEPVTFEKDAMILKEGDAGSTFYIIEDGAVVCTQQYDDGKQGELCRLEAGAYFGERALIKDEPRAATVTALEKTHCLSLSRETFNMVGVVEQQRVVGKERGRQINTERERKRE
jgi:cGMP-dependent protein kinase 2